MPKSRYYSINSICKRFSLFDAQNPATALSVYRQAERALDKAKNHSGNSPYRKELQNLHDQAEETIRTDFDLSEMLVLANEVFQSILMRYGKNVIKTIDKLQYIQLHNYVAAYNYNPPEETTLSQEYKNAAMNLYNVLKFYRVYCSPDRMVLPEIAIFNTDIFPKAALLLMELIQKSDSPAHNAKVIRLMLSRQMDENMPYFGKLKSLCEDLREVELMPARASLRK